MNAALTRPLIIGLTGGIGSGKTTVCSLFAALGTEIIDADMVARKVVAPGMPALDALARQFGEGILQADGSLDRRALRELIFRDDDARNRVETLLHPLIRSAIVQQIARSNSRWLILAAPLLLENAGYDFIDRVLVIDAGEAEQIARTARRDRCSEEEVRRIMARQLPRSERLARADDVIHNDGDLAALQTQVQDLHRRYEDLSREREHPFPV